jgi:nicotinate-nucleotide pyrophosphorylase (carboxylating)
LNNVAEHPAVRDLIRRALAEDVGAGDVTTRALIPADLDGQAVIFSRVDCVVSGLGVARAVFREVEPRLTFEDCASDGESVGTDQPLLVVRGPVRGILTAERTALNFVQRMSGIATLTRAFVDVAEPHGVAILDTRKTTPTLRILEKYAVTCGGGANHRLGLYDMALIKDNHRQALVKAGRLDLTAAVAAVRGQYPGVPVEVEVESEEDLAQVLPAAPEWIMLDNMTPEQIRRCVAQCGGRCRLEASGGVTLGNLAAVAATGVDAISVGCLTHSAPAADLSLELRV